MSVMDPADSSRSSNEPAASSLRNRPSLAIRAIPWVASAALLAAVAGGGWYAYKQTRPAPKQEQKTAVVEPYFSLAGKVRARNIVNVAAPTDGTLEQLEVDDGQEVFEGQLLARIQNTTLTTAADQAKAEVERLETRLNNLESTLISARLEASRADADASRARAAAQVAEKDYLRQRTLLAAGATARLRFEKSEADYKTARSEADSVGTMAAQAQGKVEIAQKNIEEARRLLADKRQELDDAQEELLTAEVRSPADGLLIGHRADAGGEVTRDMKDLFQIGVDLGQLECVVEATPALAARIRPGQNVVIQIVEAANEPLAGIVKSINGTQVVVEFESPNPAIKPGLTAQVRFAFE